MFVTASSQAVVVVNCPIAKASTEAFNQKYYNAEGGYYDNNTVTANLLALWYGLVPKEEEQRVFSSIVDKVVVISFTLFSFLLV